MSASWDTAQRPSDVLAMTWAQYTGNTIRLRQQKTRTLVEVPCHPSLKVHLDGLGRSGMMIALLPRLAPPPTFSARAPSF